MLPPSAAGPWAVDPGAHRSAERPGIILNAFFSKLSGQISESFWLIPALMVVVGILSAVGLVALDRGTALPEWLLHSGWLYDGGATGARTLLGTVASSTIGVAGTVFSITIAALSLAAGQMGPRLLRNFTHDRGNQITLGVFLGTFSYALMVLRSVRTQAEGDFVPHLALSVGILFALVCVATLVYFVGHMASRINVDTVIELVSEDMRSAFARLTVDQRPDEPPPADFWRDDWAARHSIAIRLLVRPGAFVFPGAPIALATSDSKSVSHAIRDATTLSTQRGSSDDLEYSARQLVEVAVRALSPGTNDPHTALGVLDRLGSGLCEIVTLYLPTGVETRENKPVLVTSSIDYDGLADAMFHMIRQNARGSTAVLSRIIEVLGAVKSCEPDPVRVAALHRHAELVVDDAQRDIKNPVDFHDVRQRHQAFLAMRSGAVSPIPGDASSDERPCRS